MGIGSLEKQSLVYGINSMERGRTRYKVTKDKSWHWGDKDIEYDLGLEKWGVQVEAPVAKARTFNAWLEDWEKELLKKDDPVAEAKLMNKYCGLMFYFIDDKKLYIVYTKELYFERGRRGWWWKKRWVMCVRNITSICW